MGHRSFARLVPLVAALAAWGIVGCAKPDARQEVVATANGEVIKVLEVREALGDRGGAVALPDVPKEMKREALERVIAVRLLALDARARGLDNTAAFRSVVAQNARGVIINALFRREVATRVKISDDDIKSQGKKLREASKSLGEDNANIQARRMVSAEKIRKIEDDLVAAARKEFPVTLNQDLVARMGKGEKLPDNAVLAAAGSEKVTFAQARELATAMAAGPHGAREPSMPQLLDREATGLALAAYARKQGIEGSEWAKGVQAELERAVLLNMLAEKEILKGLSVSDKEVAAAYAEHSEMFVRQGRKVPLAEVKSQLRDFLLNEKKRKALEAYVADLRKKATVTVKDDVLSKV